jgi:multidrug resistance efflux pump
MSKTGVIQTIYADQGHVPALPEHQTATSKSKVATVVNGLKPLIRKNKLLLALVGLVFVLSAAWYICRSVLYERTDDAQVNARIIPLSARITGQVQQVNVVEGQLVHAGDVLAVIDQRDYSIAVLEALANLAYAQNSTATLYFNAAITITSAYGALKSAQAAVKNASVEVEAAEHRLRADEAVLKHAQVDGSTTGMVVAVDQQMLLQANATLADAITNLRYAQTAPQQVSLANSEAMPETRRCCSARPSWDKPSSTSATRSFVLLSRESLARGTSKSDKA